MSRFRILQKTVSKSKHYLIDLQYIKCIFAQYLSKFFETYFEHPTCKGKSIITMCFRLLPDSNNIKFGRLQIWRFMYLKCMGIHISLLTWT